MLLTAFALLLLQSPAAAPKKPCASPLHRQFDFWLGLWDVTDPAGKFEVLARFYGPEKPLFDKTWKLQDIEKIEAH